MKHYSKILKKTDIKIYLFLTYVYIIYIILFIYFSYIYYYIIFIIYLLVCILTSLKLILSQLIVLRDYNFR